MTTSTVRAAILVAAVVVGILVLAKAFPGNTSEGLTPVGATTHSPSPTPSRHHKSSSPSAHGKHPKIKGTVVQVLNGSGKTGLAADTTLTLRNAGYTMKVPGDFAHTTTTTIYYRADSLARAQYLQRRFFAGSLLKPATASLPSDQMLTVVLGVDFAASASPSP